MRPAASVRTHTLAEAIRVIEWRLTEGARPPASPDLGERVLWLAEELDLYREHAPRPAVVDGDDVPDPHSGAKHAKVLKSLLSVADGLGGVLKR
jgi:hypothetical protein